MHARPMIFSSMYVLTPFEVSSSVDDPIATVSADTSSDAQVTDTYAPIDTSMTDYSAPSPAAPSSTSDAGGAAESSSAATTTTSSTTTITETITVSSLSLGSSTRTPMPSAYISTVMVDASGRQCEL